MLPIAFGVAALVTLTTLVAPATANCLDGQLSSLSKEARAARNLERPLDSFLAALNPVLRAHHNRNPVWVYALDCARGSDTRILKQRTAPTPREHRAPQGHVEYDIYVPVAALAESGELELARRARRSACITLHDAVGDELRLEVTRCELRAARAARDEEPNYRKWLARRLPRDGVSAERPGPTTEQKALLKGLLRLD